MSGTVRPAEIVDGPFVPSLEDLFAVLVREKQKEADAKAMRHAAEEAILARIAERPDKGRVTLTGGPVRCTVEFGLSYKADVDAIRNLGDGTVDCLPLKLRPAAYEFDERAYEALRESHPNVFAKVAQLVTTKPKKPSLELKL